MMKTDQAKWLKVPLYRISLVKENTVGYRRPKQYTCAGHFASLFRPLFAGLDREHFVVCCLDSKLRPIGINVVSIGSLNMTLVLPREVFKAAIALSSAAIVLGHNHPSGDPKPSPEDRGLTDRLKKCGEILGIKVLDHVIVGERSFACLNSRRGWSIERMRTSGPKKVL